MPLLLQLHEPEERSVFHDRTKTVWLALLQRPRPACPKHPCTIALEQLRRLTTSRKTQRRAYTRGRGNASPAVPDVSGLLQSSSLSIVLAIPVSAGRPLSYTAKRCGCGQAVPGAGRGRVIWLVSAPKDKFGERSQDYPPRWKTEGKNSF